MQTPVIVVLLLFSSLFHNPDCISSDVLLEWNPYYSLQWTDFRGAPGAEAHGDAGAVVSIKARPYVVKGKVRYDVRAFFNREKSWKRDTSDLLLAHEQLHFDIAEVYARKIRERIHDLERQGVNDVKTYNAAVRELLGESDRADRRYDAETLHGAMTNVQAKWKADVEQELVRLYRFRKERRIIR